MLRLFFVVLLGSFLTGCVATSPHLVKTNTSQIERSSGLPGVDKIILMMRDMLERGDVLKVAVSVDAKIDPNYGDDSPEALKKQSSQSSILAISLLRSNLSRYKNFSIVDTNALSNIGSATHLFAENLRYGKNGEWWGKFIDLKTNETLGEYFCYYLDDNTIPEDQRITCN